MKFLIPFRDPDKYPITQLFGEKFLYRGEIVTHKGVDWAVPKFTTLLAPFSGEIYRVEKERTTGYGKTVYIRCKDEKLGNVDALLAHCEEIIVGVGSNVKMGDNIAHSGNSGFWIGKTGYHLHFGLRINGIYVNPLPYFKKDFTENQCSLFPEMDDPAKLKAFLGDYVVKDGDTLWAIAKLFYDTGAHYVEIFNANQDILKNPNKIYPGQILRIPVLVNKGL